MPELFRRAVRLQVDTLELDGLDMSFEVLKSLEPKTSNSAEIRVWNLNADHRKALQELETVYVSLEAGYESELSLLFRGDLRTVVSRRDRVDWVTTITSESGRRGKKRRIVRSFAPGASVRSVLEEAAEAMGVRLGNTATVAVQAAVRRTKAAVWFNGYSMAGPVERELDRLARTLGLEWSVQDDELQFLQRGAALRDVPIRLAYDTGLVGSPEPGNKGLVSATCLMIGDLFPGRRVEMAAEHVQGLYRIETSKHFGGTAEFDWYVELELRSEERAA